MKSYAYLCKINKQLLLTLVALLILPITAQSAVESESSMKFPKESAMKLEIETSTSTIDSTSEDSAKLTVFKVKPTVTYKTKKYEFKTFVPMSWIKAEGQNSGDSSIRIVGRPDMSLYNSINEDSSYGIGLKLPMFSMEGLGAENYRVAQVYFGFKMSKQASQGWSYFANTSLEKDFNVTSSDQESTITIIKGAVFRGKFGVKKLYSDKIKFGSALNAMYGLSKTEMQVEADFFGEMQTFRSSLGSVKHSSLEVFGEYEASENSLFRGKLERSFKVDSSYESANLLNNIGEIDKVSDLKVSLNFVRKF